MRPLLWTVGVVYTFLFVSGVITISVRVKRSTAAENTAKTQTKLVSDHTDRDEPVPICEKVQEWPMIWKTKASFSTWGAQIIQSNDSVTKVLMCQVNGGFTLPPNGNLSFVSISIQQTNLTHFTNHTQDLSTLKVLILNGNPNFDASSLLLLGKLTSLVELDLAGTALATLNRKLRQVLKEMSSLEYLDLSYTNLHHLEMNTFQHNTKLQELNIAGNEFISLTLDQGLIQQLKHLNISNCSMEDLQVKVMEAKNRTKEALWTHLHFVDLSHNHLTSISASFMNIISCNQVSLNITDNLWDKSCTLCSYYHVWNYASEHPDKVHGVNHNCFRPKEALKMCGWEECPPTCTCNPDTKTVDCSSTELKTIPYLGPSDAEILLLKNNSLLNMSGIESSVWCHLKTINADYNRMASIMPPDIVGQCTCFDDNSVYEKEENCLPQSLQKLSLNHNKIKNLSHSDCQLLYPLRELHLSDNKVEHLGGYVCGSLELLESLHISNNSYSNLKEEDVAPYPNLKELNLSFNQLVILPYRIIELIRKLRVLDVSHNKLRTLTRKTSTPDTPFTSLVPDSLQELDLSNNSLRKIKSVLSLEHIPTLKKLSMQNNPWECTCEIITDLWNAASMNADLMNTLRILKCQKLASMRGVLISKALENCPKNESQGQLSVVVAVLIIIIVVGIIVKATYRKITPNIYNVLGLTPNQDATFRRRYSVFIVHSDEDYTMVKTDLVDPLEELNYSVAWNENAFLPGDNSDDSIEKAVLNSRRMLVVASKNFLTHLHGKRIIQRGLTEERNVCGYKVVALVMDDLPEVLYEDLNNIIVRKIHVLRRNRNYFRKICNILPSPLPARPIITFTETDLWEFFRRRLENIHEREMQRTHLQEVFPSNSLDSLGNSVGIVNTSYINDEQEVVQIERFTRGEKLRCTTRF